MLEIWDGKYVSASLSRLIDPLWLPAEHSVDKDFELLLTGEGCPHQLALSAILINWRCLSCWQGGRLWLQGWVFADFVQKLTTQSLKIYVLFIIIFKSC